jgi:proteasome beta subunit
VTPPRPLIFFYDPLGAQFQAVGYAASGSGSGSIRSILSYQEKYGSPKPSQMDLGEAVQFSLRLLMNASEFDAATGGINPETNTYATVKILDGTGVRTIHADEQARYLQALAPIAKTNANSQNLKQ